MSSTHTASLEGLKILDLTQFVSGPFCTQILADLGARVVKVERPPSGDPYRKAGPSFVGGESTLFLSLNRGKESLALNLKEREGREVFLEKLVPQFDVVVENFSPGTMDSLGIGYELCKKVNPSLIFSSISGFGTRGPYKEKKGFDLILQSVTGIMDLTGEKDSGPVKVAIPITDFVAGFVSAIGILAESYRKVMAGKEGGSILETSLYESSLSLLSILATEYFASGQVPHRMGSASPTFAPYQAFKCRDKYITIAGAGSEEIWHRFVDALGLSKLAEDSRFRMNSDRVRNQEALAEIISEKLHERDAAEWLELLDAKGIPCGPVNKLSDVLTNEQTNALELISKTPVRNHDATLYESIRFPLTIDQQRRLQSTLSPPCLGEHTDTILSEVGVSPAELRGLRERKVVV